MLNYVAKYFLGYIKITDDILYEFRLRSLDTNVCIVFTVLGLYLYSFISYVRKKKLNPSYLL